MAGGILWPEASVNISFTAVLREDTGVSEFMISCVKTRISFCHDSSSCSSQLVINVLAMTEAYNLFP